MCPYPRTGMRGNPEAFRRLHRLEDAIQTIPSDVDSNSHATHWNSEQQAAGPEKMFA